MIYTQIVGLDSGDSSPALLLVTNTNKFLFGCGDGQQRMFQEYHIKIPRIKGIFLWNTSPETIGGLPGLLFTMADTNLNTIKLFGPNNELNSWWDLCKEYFFYRPDFNLLINDGISDYYRSGLVKSLENECLLIDRWINLSDGIWARSISKEFLINIDSNEITKEGPIFKKRRFIDNSFGSVLLYIVQTPTILGKFNPKAAIDLGVPKGPLFGALHRGEDVILENGTTIHSNQCCSSPKPGPKFGLIICRNIDDIYLLRKNYSKWFLEYSEFPQGPKKEETGELVCIYHFSPWDIVKKEPYQEFINEFPKSVKHILVNREACGSPYIHRTQSQQQTRMNLIDNNIFPLLWKNTFMNKELETENVVNGMLMQKFNVCQITPFGIDNSEVNNDIDETLIINSIDDSIKKFNLQREQIENETTITFLGTGGAIPGKYRNVSGIYFDLIDSGFMFDVGESSYGQMHRKFGENIVKSKLINLKMIWISHMHADHHLGILRVLKERRKLVDESNKLLIVAPYMLGEWLNNYSRYCDSEISGFNFVECSFFNNDFLKDPIISFMGFIDIQVAHVDHCQNAFGIAFTHKDGWKFSYSGDTRPCDSFIDIAKNSTIMIHEATFDNELIEEAKDRKHSTYDEAINVAISSKSKNLILSHFSQRYPKIPKISNSSYESFSFAFDFMTISYPSDLSVLSSLMAPLGALYESLEEKEKEADK